MKKNLIVASIVAGVAGAALLVSVWAQPWSGGDGDSSAAIDPVSHSGQESVNEQPAPPGTAQEGIAVHGHWTIEVRESDGRFVSRTEFDNLLTAGGQQYLAMILTRALGLPAWGIQLINDSPPDGGPCDTVDDTIRQDCIMIEATAGSGLTTWPNATFFNTLTVSTDNNGWPITLQGTAIAETDGTIERVDSLICASGPPSVDPAVCNNGTTFTLKVLDVPVSLLTGQQILVTVTITFS